MITTKILILNPIRTLLLALATMLVLFFVAASVFSQSPTIQPTTTTGASFNLNFPVEELGSCKNLEECTNYCEDPVNYNSCSSFAKKNGFYQDDVTTYAGDEFYEGAQSELGCNSGDTCLSFCSQEANFDACSTFAKRNEVPGGYVGEPDKPEYLSIAKTVLGCDSAATCSTFCDNPANAQKCGSFADQVGLLGGTTSEGPGGCQTPGTCSAYCSDPAHYGECSQFAPPGGTFSGPGGCNSETGCRSYCDQNPVECRSYAPGSSGFYVPIVCSAGETHGPSGVCTGIADIRPAVECINGSQYWDGSTCQANPPVGISTVSPSGHFEPRPEMGNCITPGECYDYCTTNPGSCPGFDASGPRPTDDYTPYLYYTPGTDVKFEPKPEMGNCDSPGACYDYCKENPGKCEGFDSKAPEPVDIWIPNTYYTPPEDAIYNTPPITNFYTTPIYYTPPEGSTYVTPQYYTPGIYSTPSYQTPPPGSNYATPNYYTPWADYATPTGEYPTPTYATPTYYTPPIGSNYTTPYYYTPPQYTTPYYYTPPAGSNYTTPTYSTPPPYVTPQYYTPYTGGGYTTPIYYTPPIYTTPIYHTPPPGSDYTTPIYYTPPTRYTTPNYYTPGTYPTPITYSTPPPYTTPIARCPPEATSCFYSTPAPYFTPIYPTPPPYITPHYWTPYTTPNYPTPDNPNYPTPPYYTPYTTPIYPTPQYPSPYSYPTPGTPYGTPSYPYPTPGTPYSTPSYPSPNPYSYPTPGSPYNYPSPYYTPGSPYSTPSYPSPYSYPTPGTPYSTPSYGTPSGIYGTPSYGSPTYGTPAAYGTPSYGTPTESYGTPAYGTPPSYGTPSESYGTPSYGTPSEVHGTSICDPGLLQTLWGILIDRPCTP